MKANSWNQVELSDPFISKLIMGQSPPSSSYNIEGNGLPFYQGKKEFGDHYPTPEVFCTAPNKIAEKGDILLSVRAPVGPTNLCLETSCIGRGLAAIRPNIKNVSTSFLLYYFKFFEFELATKGQGSTFDAISKKVLETLLIPLPPLPEQLRLVTKLDSLLERTDKAIALVEQNISNSKHLMASMLNDVFTVGMSDYKQVPIMHYVEFIGGSQPPKQFFSNEKKDGYVRLIQIRDYKSNDYLVHIRSNSTKKFCDETDVMIGRYGPPVFQILRGLNGAYNVALMKAKPNENYISKEFLYWFLQNPNIQEYIIGISQRSAGQSGVNKSALEKYNIPVPPLTVQKKISENLAKIFHRNSLIVEKQAQRKTNLIKLKSSLLDAAFKGEL